MRAKLACVKRNQNSFVWRMGKTKRSAKDKTKPIFSPVERGRKGGLAGKGESKSRSPEIARAAVKVRWQKYRKAKRAASKGPVTQTPITTTTGRLC
jgi:hypothetical protein